jgi:hypothetical protein
MEHYSQFPSISIERHPVRLRHSLLRGTPLDRRDSSLERIEPMPKRPEWEIQVGRKAEILANFRVPMYKLPRKALQAFLRALVIRYRTDTPEEMLPFYVSKTRGAPDRLPYAEVSDWPLDRGRLGYWCGTWECYASALWELDAKTLEAVMMEIQKNIRATARR